MDELLIDRRPRVATGHYVTVKTYGFKNLVTRDLRYFVGKDLQEATEAAVALWSNEPIKLVHIGRTWQRWVDKED